MVKFSWRKNKGFAQNQPIEGSKAMRKSRTHPLLFRDSFKPKQTKIFLFIFAMQANQNVVENVIVLM